MVWGQGRERAELPPQPTAVRLVEKNDELADTKMHLVYGRRL